MRDKALAEVSGILFPRAAKLILTAPAQARAARPETLLEMSGHPDAVACPGIGEALARYREGALPGDVAFVTGSLFLVGEALLHVA